MGFWNSGICVMVKIHFQSSPRWRIAKIFKWLSHYNLATCFISHDHIFIRLDKTPERGG